MDGNSFVSFLFLQLAGSGDATLTGDKEGEGWTGNAGAWYMFFASFCRCAGATIGHIIVKTAITLVQRGACVE